MARSFLQRIDDHQPSQRLTNRHWTGAELFGKFAQAHNLTRLEGSGHQPTAQALENHFLNRPPNPRRNGTLCSFLDIVINVS
jgi:hypothetical protein